jgi:MYXO-CTERM domain-containing protein
VLPVANVPVTPVQVPALSPVKILLLLLLLAGVAATALRRRED